MVNKLMYIPNNDTQNYHFCRLRLVVETFQHSTKRTNQSKLINRPKVVKTTNKKTLVTSVINSALSSLSLSESNKSFDLGF